MGIPIIRIAGDFRAVFDPFQRSENRLGNTQAPEYKHERPKIDQFGAAFDFTQYVWGNTECCFQI